ncbi:hypothetical protein [Entomobacter blattae]|uniref:Uncharacterized protein n=1 Tax=Entomobacter blattae TaxID=2762277 RepID=A0A7H1NUZ8_9PROT|nr:hypothetical protein [Entomobacter blattae]QNT79608.1 hypothetical protein JGUZn3_24080 [Entomobacter blattae]
MDAVAHIHWSSIFLWYLLWPFLGASILLGIPKGQWVLRGSWAVMVIQFLVWWIGIISRTGRPVSVLFWEDSQPVWACFLVLLFSQLVGHILFARPWENKPFQHKDGMIFWCLAGLTQFAIAATYIHVVWACVLGMFVMVSCVFFKPQALLARFENRAFANGLHVFLPGWIISLSGILLAPYGGDTAQVGWVMSVSEGLILYGAGVMLHAVYCLSVCLQKMQRGRGMGVVFLPFFLLCLYGLVLRWPERMENIGIQASLLIPASIGVVGWGIVQAFRKNFIMASIFIHFGAALACLGLKTGEATSISLLLMGVLALITPLGLWLEKGGCDNKLLLFVGTIFCLGLPPAGFFIGDIVLVRYLFHQLFWFGIFGIGVLGVLVVSGRHYFYQKIQESASLETLDGGTVMVKPITAIILVYFLASGIPVLFFSSLLYGTATELVATTTKAK